MLFTGPYAADGSILCTAADATTTGLYMPNGYTRIHIEAITGLYSSSGGLRYTIAGANTGLYAPDGSIYVVDGSIDGGFGVYNAQGNVRVSGTTL